MNLGRVSTRFRYLCRRYLRFDRRFKYRRGRRKPQLGCRSHFPQECLFRLPFQPAAIGFAELSEAAGGSSGECCNLALPFIVLRSRRFQLIKAPRPLLFRLPLLVLQARQLEVEVEMVAAVVAPLVVRKLAFYASAIVIDKSFSSFYSGGFVQDLVRDASDGRCLSAYLPILSGTQSAVLTSTAS
jgi:hypothetical protein